MNVDLRTEIGAGCQVEIEEKSHYLLALLRGVSPSLEGSLKIWKSVADRCIQRNYNKVLIDEDFVGQISFSEINQLAEQLPQLGFIGIKVAFLDRQVDQYMMNQFGENVAVNRGLNGRAFCDFTEAEHWLLS